jgi:hypothetical protein
MTTRIKIENCNDAGQPDILVTNYLGAQRISPGCSLEFYVYNGNFITIKEITKNSFCEFCKNLVR